MLGMTGKLGSGCVFQVLFWFHVLVFQPHLSQGQAVGPAVSRQERTIHGVVKSGNMPIPGAGVSAANTVTKEQVSTWTDVDGSYWLRIPVDGHYTVRVQMAAFAAGAQEVVLDATHPDMQANFELVLLSRAREARGDEARSSDEARAIAIAIETSSGVPMRADVAFRIFPCFRVMQGRMQAGRRRFSR